MTCRSLAVAGLLLCAVSTTVTAQPAYDVRPRGESAAPAFLPDVPTSTPLAPPPSAVAPPQPVQQAVALSPPEARSMTKLPLPAAHDAAAARTRSGSGTGFASMLGGLGVVLLLFLAVVALLRRGMPNQARLLPTEAVEILGRLPLPGRQQGHLVRVGNKISLISFTSGGAEPLVEITDPLEVDRLAGLCRQRDPHSATTSFRGVVEQFFREKPSSSTGTAPTVEDDDA